MSDSTDRLNDNQGTARMDAGTARIGASQSASPAGGGTIFADGQTLDLNGRNCVIEKLISMGSGEAVVYKIQIDGKPYALKHYKLNTPLSDTAKKLLTKIRDNPRENVVKIIDFGSHNGQDFEIMEYAEGGTLDHYLRKAGGIKDINNIKSMVKQINEGLQQLHGYYKAIYQDLKPENIFFKDAARTSLVLADFGISSVMHGDNEEVEVTASVTDLYAAPELARKGNNTQVIVTPAVDYFALGITMYELWLGEQPFKEIKATTRERRIQNKDVDFPIDMPDACKTLLRGLIDPLSKDRMGNEQVQKWLKGEALTLDSNKPVTVTDTVYKPLKFGSEFASNPKEMAALMEKYPDAGKVCLYDEFITNTLKEANDVTLYTEIKNVISQYGKDQQTGLTAAIYTLDPETPFISRKGKICKSNEEIADAIWDDQAHYMEDLNKPNADLYVYIAVTGGSQGKESADTFYKYFVKHPPNRALTLVYLKLQSDGGITIGSKRYLSTDELAQEKDSTQINFIKQEVKEKDSKLLVWISDEYGDYFKSTDEFTKLSIPEQFFLLGLLPFLSYKELSGSNGEAALQDLINYYPGRSDLFEAYVSQGLPLKGSILDSPDKKTPIDYVVRNFNDLTKMHGRDTVFNLIRLLHKLGADINEYSSDGTGPFMNALAKDDDLVRTLSLTPSQLVSLLFELGAEGDFVSHAGTVCKRGNGEDIANAIMAESDYYKRNLKQNDASLYLYLAATEGSQGKEFAQTFRKYFNEYSPERALALVYINLLGDRIIIGSKYYQNSDELTQEKDQVQIDLVKKAVTEKDSLLLVWLSCEYKDRFNSTEAYGNLPIPDKFFLLGILPFLSYKEYNDHGEDNAVSDLRFLIDNVPGRSELFEAYAAQGLPLKGQMFDDSSVKKTVIDYIVCHFDDIKKHGEDSVRNLIRLLCKRGADVNENSSDGKCPLVNAFEAFLAAKNDLIKLLLETGADPRYYREFLDRKEEKELKEQEEQARRKADQDKQQAEQERKYAKEREKARLKREAVVKRGRITKLAVAAVITLIAGYFIIAYVNKVSLYKQATEALSKGEYESAINKFKTLGDFRDSSSMTVYAQAEEAVFKGDYTTAIEHYETVKYFRDSGMKKQQAIYMDTITTFVADISEKSGRFITWRNVVNDVLSNVFGTANRHTVGLLADRTVVATGYNKDGRINLSNWRNIVAVSARVEGGHTLGLRMDGTVIAAGYNQDGQCNVSAWRSIKAISAGEDHSVGLRTDGTVVAVGKNSGGQCNVAGWRNIVAVSAGGSHSVGLRADGTVIAAGNNDYGQCNVSDWEDIVAVSAGGNHTIGLKADGTVIAVGRNASNQCNVSDWGDIVAVSAGGSHSVGLRTDGTVVAAGNNLHGQCNVSDWKDVVAVSAGGNHTVGLKTDSMIYATGNNTEGQLYVHSWRIDWQKIATDQVDRIK
jgi:serine/threonine protein kinase